MNKVLIVGDGPGGLGAALFLAKNGVEVDVFGTDDTPMHKALLLNYLGIEKITGSEFQALARHQVESFGARLHKVKVEKLERTEGGFRVQTAQGESFEGKYIILATTNKTHQEALGVARGDGEATVDRDGRTNVERCYAIGWAARRHKIQAIISAGDGAVAALDILSLEKGEDFHDFDVV